MNNLTNQPPEFMSCRLWPVEALFLFLIGTLCVRAETTFTNWDGLFFGITVSETNVIAGGKVAASMIVSNTLDRERYVGWSHGNACSSGFGEFLIIEKNSGKRADCIVPLEDRGAIISASLGKYEKHTARTFEFDLVEGYAVTNAGVYTVQAVGQFHSLEASDKHFTVTTPPITIVLSPSGQTNNAAK
jgi:hypothetical protein